jgi:hypothetical protein
MIQRRKKTWSNIYSNGIAPFRSAQVEERKTYTLTWMSLLTGQLPKKRKRDSSQPICDIERGTRAQIEEPTKNLYNNTRNENFWWKRKQTEERCLQSFHVAERPLIR